MSGWTTKKLGEVCEVQLGKMLDKAKNKGKPYKYLANLSVRWRSFDLSNLRTMPFMDSEVEKFSLRPGDILMCEGGEPGRCAIWQIPDSDIKFQKAVHRIRSKGTIEPAYLVAYFESIVNTVEFNSRLTGATIKHLPRERLLEIPIPIPPLAEQKRIVAKIDVAFAKIDRLKANAEKNLANAKELFQSALDEAMRPKKGWVEKRLGELGETLTGMTPSTKDKSNFGDFMPFVKPGDIVPFTPIHFRDDGLSRKGVGLSRLVKRDSVLMVCIGASIGKTGYADRDCTCNQQINALMPQGYNGRYLYYLLSSEKFKTKLIDESGQTTLPIISKSKWENLSVCISLSLSEQTGIVKTLDVLSTKIEALQQNYVRQIEDCAEMRQAILREAFEGRL